MDKVRLREVIGRFHPFPIGIFLGVVFLICAGLAVSATYGYITLSSFRTQYLQNLGHEIAGALDAQARGPGRRNNPAFWQNLMDEKYHGLESSVAFISLLDQTGRILAGTGDRNAPAYTSPPGYFIGNGRSVYIFEQPVFGPRQSSAGMTPQVSGWRIRVALYTSITDFIRRQAIIQVLVTGAAILTLLVLSYFLLLTLNRFIELKSREQSERHLKALGAMSAALAHEIRNPLGAMKGLTQLVQEDLPEDHSAQTLMKTVVSEAERLEVLVSDLLNFARPKLPSLSKFDYEQLVHDVEAMLEPRLRENEKSLAVSVLTRPLIIHSDEHGLRQVLLNTLLNAIDFTPKGGRIILNVRRDENPKAVVTEIDDSGPGLGNQDPEELFEPFITTKTKGTGLGLAVSRQIIDALGGTIRLENLPGGGARCTIILGEREGDR